MESEQTVNLFIGSDTDKFFQCLNVEIDFLGLCESGSYYQKRNEDKNKSFHRVSNLDRLIVDLRCVP